jgi:DNA-binding GntR family transcriptional regulator
MEPQPPHRTLRSWVYASLKERIITVQIEPGTTLVETQLATEMGVSRSPIREALRQLSKDGLVLTLPNSATTVAPINESDIEQIFEMRDLLESCLVAHAAEVRTEDDLIACDTLLATMPAIIDAVDIPSYAENDATFHTMLWSMAKRQRITETLLPLADHSRRYLNAFSRWLQSESEYTLMASHSEHIAVLQAIRDQDSEEATSAIRIHMNSSRNRIMQGLWNARGGMRAPITAE